MIKDTVVLKNENCLDAMKDIPDEYIDLTVTSPPYDNLRTYNGIEWNECIWRSVIKELFRITKQGGVAVWVVGDATINGSETGTSFKQALWAKHCGFRLHDTMIYQKTNYQYPMSNRYYQVFEYMFVFSNGVPKTTNLLRCQKKRILNKPTINTRRQPDGTLKKTYISNNDQTRIQDNVWKISAGYQNSTTDISWG